MTPEERKIVFVYSKLCSIEDELAHCMNFFHDHGAPKVKEFESVFPLVSAAHTAANAAKEALFGLANKYTNWGDDND